MSLLSVLTLVSSLSFLIYGAQCLVSPRMETEFRRYGFEELVKPIGLLEFLAGIGLLVGFAWPPASSVSSAGLFLLMVGAVAVRIRIKDGILRSLPASILMLLNLYILLASRR